jgi:hypothetical protein
MARGRDCPRGFVSAAVGHGDAMTEADHDPIPLTEPQQVPNDNDLGDESDGAEPSPLEDARRSAAPLASGDGSRGAQASRA